MNFPQAIRIIQDAKAHRPGLITMMGGPHVSFDVENTLARYPELDLIVIGEGEATLKELIPALPDRQVWKSIAGIAFRENGATVTTANRALIADLDTLPLPARHLLPISRYLALGFPVSIITSRGCPNKCIFCLGRRMVGHKPRFRSPKQVVDEIEQILAYGFTWINIADDLFTASKKRVLAFCDEITRRGVKFIWSAFARVNTVDFEMLAAMKAAGCDSIGFGVESGNQQILQTANKGITLAQIRNAVALSKAAGLRVHASFIVGLPGESHATLAETQRFAESLDVEYGYHLLAPFPGTTLREEIKRYDLEILTDDWSRYDANQAIVSYAHLSPQEMDAFVDTLYRKHQAKNAAAEKRYLAGNCPPEEFMMFEGWHRMKLVFELFSKDIIEALGILPVNGSDPAAPLATAVKRTTGLNADLVRRSLQSFIQAGYLKSRPVKEGLQWFWTYNKQLDRAPAV
ncbi:MAG: radical SAM protein [Desulfobacteraceae bacterium]|nr:MAG: radical SAM protein [Desulfobacteraceae bacterium]